MRAALLANPQSGSGEAERVERLLRDQGATVERFALEAGDEAVPGGADRVVVAGGDGTIGAAAEAAARAAVPLAVIPVGTANDFARALALPNRIDEACALAVHGSVTRRLDLARIDGRPFVNVASAGLSPLAARKARGLKGALGPVAYALGALRAGLTAAPLRCRVEVDGRSFFDGRAWQVSVACTGAFGAGAELDADPADGLLDIVAIEAGPRLRLIARAHGLRSGRVEAQDGVEVASGREVAIRTDGGGELVGFTVDGELVESPTAEFTIEPRAFAIVVGVRDSPDAAA